MHILSTLFFAVSSSSDNFVVGLSYGIKKVKINMQSNVIVATISGLGTLLSMLLGNVFRSFLLPLHANVVGCILLILLGVYMIITSLRERANRDKTVDNVNNFKADVQNYEYVLKNPEVIDVNKSKEIEFNEAISLGVILCLNNIGLGIGASITGLNIFATSISSFIFSIIFVQLGCIMGKHLLSDKLASYADFISGFIVIALGIYELFI